MVSQLIDQWKICLMKKTTDQMSNDYLLLFCHSFIVNIPGFETCELVIC